MNDGDSDLAGFSDNTSVSKAEFNCPLRTLHIQCTRSDGTPAKNLPYSITFTQLNTPIRSTLDANGMAEHDNLPNGHVIVEFGEPEDPNEKKRLRAEIKKLFDDIVKAEQAEAARISAEKGDGAGAIALSAGEGFLKGALGLLEFAWDTVKVGAKIIHVASPWNSAQNLLQATWEGFNGEGSFIDEFAASMEKERKEELVWILGFDPSEIDPEQITKAIAEAYEIASFIIEDPDTFALFQNFAHDYAMAQSATEIAGLAGGAVFEIVLTVLLAVFTGGTGTVAVAAKNARHLEKFEQLAPPLRRLVELSKNKTQNIRETVPSTGIHQDKLHKPEGINVPDIVKENNPRTRLPRTSGHWEGKPGDGYWHSDLEEVNEITGGKPIEFRNGRPIFTPWSKGRIRFEPGELDGSRSDFKAVYE